MGDDIYNAGLHLKLSNTMAVKLTVLTYVLLVGLVSNASPQRTYQRACDCEYMVNGKCAYTLLLPTGTNDGTCPGAGAGPPGSETIDYLMRNITNRVNDLYDIAMNQSLFLNGVQGAIIALQQNKYQSPPSLNDSSDWLQRQEAALASLNATLQSGAKDLQQLKTTTDMLARNISSLAGFLQLQTTKLTNLTSVVNETKAALDKRTADDAAKISQLSDVVRLLRQASCGRRGALFSGPDRLNGTNITFSSSYDSTFGPQQLAIDNTGTPGAWCPREPHENSWVQFDIGRSVQVFGIATRGRSEYDQWIATYNIQYVPNNSSGVPPEGDTLNWVYFKDIVGGNQSFQGNTDRSSIQLNMLWNPIYTRYVRLLPLTGANGGNVCTRAEIIGCVDEI